MNRVTYKFMLRADYSPVSGKKGIYLYANINGKTKFYSTGLSVLETKWDIGKQRPKPGCSDFAKINTRIIEINSRLNDIVLLSDMGETVLTQSDICEIFVKKRLVSPDLVEWMELDLKNFSGKYAKETIHTYKAQLSKLKEFNRSILFTDITPAWWYRYEQFMTERGNCVHTRHKCFTHLKTFINKAVESGILETNPLKAVKVKTGKGNRVYLSKDEFLQLIEYYNNCKYGMVKNALRCFLFACYTGLRYTDVKLLTWEKVKGPVIELQFHKTAKFDVLPLNKKALELLPVRGEKKISVFRVPSNQKINEYLKTGITAAGIDKPISFHCARHTFATLLLEATGNIAVVSKLLGHSNITTTQIYAKVLESEKEKAVLLMDGF